ncbi:hypothetical protein QTI82_06155 [Clostridium perfringens]|uniref:hypothetical protein n=1 Tax=Clostridium perfringens TaxID=1502 RepID=UPI000E14898C|nr:hypothetical protein [Clostridium perfringens]MDM0896970.1 hypothetical protein [Clostridium perfringens]MDM0928134.1 hypothetical protein [Clostridium perfringens]MDM0951773.1 hypothetical protein [Clostridium perfringens]SUY38692.1 endo-beta-N-acetylglucosaminidase [Clostridium perfringens]HBZ6545944.1 hypothetical protein [Clostridium perfringens]
MDSLFPEKTSIKLGGGSSSAILDRIEVNKDGGTFVLKVKSLGKKAVRYEVKYTVFREVEIQVKTEATKNIKILGAQKEM